MSDKENNMNEEEYEEENLNLMNNPMDNENPEEDEGQDVYAFDIKIDDESSLLVIGKTEENKILLRLGDKVDQNKPFFQNEFSLDDLRKINPIFDNVEDEDFAFNYLASNLNDAEKEIKLIDDDKIKFIIYILDEEQKYKIDFPLIKYLDENMNDNENENENGEDMMEEGVEIMNDLIDNNNEIDNENGNVEEHQIEQNLKPAKEIQVQKEEVQIEPKEKKEANLPLQIEEKKEKKEIKEIKESKDANTDIQQNKSANVEIKEINNPKLEQDMILMKQELLSTINALNENFNSQILKQSEAFNKIKEELIKENDIKINKMKEELNNKENLISELQNKIGNLEAKLAEVNNKYDNINLNNLNNGNIPDDNNNNNINAELINENNEKIMNKINEINKKISGIKEEFDNDKNNNDNNIQILNEKIINLENDLQKNKNENKNKKDNTDNNLKIVALENDLKNLESKINEYEIDQIIENIALISEKLNDTKVYEIINNLENQINNIKDKVNKSNRDSFSKKQNTNNDPEIMNKLNNYENIISMLQNQIKKIQDDKKNESNNKSKLDKTILELSNNINDLNTKTASLLSITKKLESDNKELNTKTNNIMSNVSKISSASTQYANNNIHPSLQMSQLKNVPQNYYHTMESQNQNVMQKKQANYYSKTNPNLNNNMLSNPKNSINSKIVNFEDIIFLFNRLKEIHPKIKDINFTLVYRASEDGDRASDFHQRCDKIGPNVVLIKTKRGNIFGGFTLKNWEHMPRDIDKNRPNLGSASRDSKAFGFSVNNQKVYI